MGSLPYRESSTGFYSQQLYCRFDLAERGVHLSLKRLDLGHAPFDFYPSYVASYGTDDGRRHAAECPDHLGG